MGILKLILWLGSILLLTGCGIDRIEPYPRRPADEVPWNIWDVSDVGNHRY